MNPKILTSLDDASPKDGRSREVTLPAATMRYDPFELASPRPVRQVVLANAEHLGNRRQWIGGFRGHDIYRGLVALRNRLTQAIFRHVTNEWVTLEGRE